MGRELTAEALRAVRLQAQLLTKPADAVVDVVAKVAIQAQDMSAARLAIRARSTGLTTADVDAAHRRSHQIVWTWLMRGTLHLVPAADVRWMVNLLGPIFIRTGRRRREQLGVDDRACARALPLIEQALVDGALSRAELVERLVGAGVKVDPATQAPAHLLSYAAYRGLICRGPQTEANKPTYVLVDQVLSTVRQHVPEDALAELARYYLRGHPVATPADFTAWSGLPAAEGRQAFDRIRDELVAIGAGFALGSTNLSSLRKLPARLLGAFDPYLLGYRSRDLIVDSAHAVTIRGGGGGGMIAPTVLAAGKLVGIWKLDRVPKKGLHISVQPFSRLPRGTRADLEEEAADIGRFLDTPASLSIGKKFQ